MLSVCMIVQDEEACIARALDSVHNYDYIEEIIVLDGGSTDRTIEIASTYTKVKLHTYPFKPLEGDRIDEQRNRAIDLATNEWILFLDADEYYESYTMLSIPYLLSKEYLELNQCDAFLFSRKNFLDNRLTNPIKPDYQCKLFKRYCRFVGIKHESLTGYNKSITTNLDIQHYKTATMQQLDNERCWELGQEHPGWEKVEGRWQRVKG